MRLPRLTLAAAAVSLALLTGCAGPVGEPAETTTPPVAETPTATATATASPEPSTSATAEPEADDRPVISTAGFGDVKLGAPVPDGLDYATWDPDYCGDTGAFIKAGTTRDDEYDYVIGTGKVNSPKSDVVGIIMLGKKFKTPSGVHVGQSFETVEATLPQMKRYKNGYEQSKLYIVKDDLGQLTFEFAEGELKVITSLANSVEPFQIWYSDAAAICGA